MKQTKLRFQKTNGILAFHGYQAFAPGETAPEVAHAIGVKLAQELWGERFEVVVSTHLDKKHLHNHFVINSVSFLDGKRYIDNKSNDRLLPITEAALLYFERQIALQARQKELLPYLALPIMRTAL